MHPQSLGPAARLLASLEVKANPLRQARRFARAMTGGNIGGGGTRIDSLGRSWDPSLHPRDAQGRFIETGGSVRTFDGKVGKVVRALPGSRIEILTPTGERLRRPARQVNMVARPDGSEPTQDQSAVQKEDARRAGRSNRGDGRVRDDLGDADGDGISDDRDPDPDGDGVLGKDKGAGEDEPGRKRASTKPQGRPKDPAKRGKDGRRFTSVDAVKKHWSTVKSPEGTPPQVAQAEAASRKQIAERIKTTSLSPRGQFVIGAINGEWAVLHSGTGKPVARRLADRQDAVRRAAALEVLTAPAPARAADYDDTGRKIPQTAEASDTDVDWDRDDLALSAAQVTAVKRITTGDIREVAARVQRRLDDEERMGATTPKEQDSLQKRALKALADREAARAAEVAPELQDDVVAQSARNAYDELDDLSADDAVADSVTGRATERFEELAQVVDNVDLTPEDREARTLAVAEKISADADELDRSDAPREQVQRLRDVADRVRDAVVHKDDAVDEPTPAPVAEQEAPAAAEAAPAAPQAPAAAPRAPKRAAGALDPALTARYRQLTSAREGLDREGWEVLQRAGGDDLSPEEMQAVQDAQGARRQAVIDELKDFQDAVLRPALLDAMDASGDGDREVLPSQAAKVLTKLLGTPVTTSDADGILVRAEREGLVAGNRNGTSRRYKRGTLLAGKKTEDLSGLTDEQLLARQRDRNGVDPVGVREQRRRAQERGEQRDPRAWMNADRSQRDDQAPVEDTAPAPAAGGRETITLTGNDSIVLGPDGSFRRTDATPAPNLPGGTRRAQAADPAPEPERPAGVGWDTMSDAELVTATRRQRGNPQALAEIEAEQARRAPADAPEATPDAPPARDTALAARTFARDAWYRNDSPARVAADAEAMDVPEEQLREAIDRMSDLADEAQDLIESDTSSAYTASDLARRLRRSDVDLSEASTILNKLERDGRIGSDGNGARKRWGSKRRTAPEAPARPAPTSNRDELAEELRDRFGVAAEPDDTEDDIDQALKVAALDFDDASRQRADGEDIDPERSARDEANTLLRRRRDSRRAAQILSSERPAREDTGTTDSTPEVTDADREPAGSDRADALDDVPADQDGGADRPGDVLPGVRQDAAGADRGDGGLDAGADEPRAGAGRGDARDGGAGRGARHELVYAQVEPGRESATPPSSGPKPGWVDEAPLRDDALS